MAHQLSRRQIVAGVVAVITVPVIVNATDNAAPPSTSQPSAERQTALSRYSELKTEVLNMASQASKTDPLLFHAKMMILQLGPQQQKDLANAVEVQNYLSDLPAEKVGQRASFRKVQALQELLVLREMFGNDIAKAMLYKLLKPRTAMFNRVELSLSLAQEDVKELGRLPVTDPDAIEKLIESNAKAIQLKRDEIASRSELPEAVLDAAKSEPSSRLKIQAAREYLEQYTPEDLKRKQEELERMRVELNVRDRRSEARQPSEVPSSQGK